MHGHITSLAVARTHRKLGLATKLMTAAREHAGSQPPSLQLRAVRSTGVEPVLERLMCSDQCAACHLASECAQLACLAAATLINPCPSPCPCCRPRHGGGVWRPLLLPARTRHQPWRLPPVHTDAGLHVSQTAGCLLPCWHLPRSRDGWADAAELAAGTAPAWLSAFSRGPPAVHLSRPPPSPPLHRLHLAPLGHFHPAAAESTTQRRSTMQMGRMPMACASPSAPGKRRRQTRRQRRRSRRRRQRRRGRQTRRRQGAGRAARGDRRRRGVRLPPAPAGL